MKEMEIEKKCENCAISTNADLYFYCDYCMFNLNNGKEYRVIDNFEARE